MENFDESLPPAPAPEAQDVTVAMLDQLVADIFAKKKEIEASELVTTGLNKEKMALEAKCVNYLKALGREEDGYSTKYGFVGISKKWRVNMPATDADKAALFDWMRERGIFDRFATVNANSLNSLYMAEWEAAKRAGQGMEFSMPGIGERKYTELLATRKGK